MLASELPTRGPVVARARAQDQHLGRGLLQHPDEVVAGEARRRSAVAGTTTRSKLSRSSRRSQRVAVGAAALDPGVDRHPLGGRALLDRLQHRHRLLRLGGNRAFQRQLLGNGRQVGRHQGRALGPGEAQRRVDRAAGDLGAGEGQQDPAHGFGPLRALAAPPRSRQQVAAAEAEEQGEPDEEVLDHDSSSFWPRWAMIRTSTPGGVARISACGSGVRSRASPRGGVDSPTMM